MSLQVARFPSLEKNFKSNIRNQKLKCNIKLTLLSIYYIPKCLFTFRASLSLHKSISTYYSQLNTIPPLEEKKEKEMEVLRGEMTCLKSHGKLSSGL